MPDRRVRDVDRFTPASAESTAGPSPRHSRTSVHPCVGREHGGEPRTTQYTRGSPPLRRGAPVGVRAQLGEQRFTSASTRSTPSSGTWRTGRPVHPRGARAMDLVPTAEVWFTPASAGSTSSPKTSVSCPSVHPRLGREHEAWPSATYSRAVRPARRGGPLRLDRPARRHGRFTPASAGTTSRGCAPCPSPPVHPHVGGEHARTVQKVTPMSGSPLMRLREFGSGRDSVNAQVGVRLRERFSWG